MRIPNLYSLLSFLVLSSLVSAQTNLEVVTKTVEKTIAMKINEHIIIGAQNATINVQAWEKNETFVRMKLITKHRIKNVAIAEQENVKNVIDKKGNTLYLRNYFVDDGKSSGCIVKVEYEVWLPAQCNVEIKNNLGNITVKGLRGELKVENKFGNIDLQDIHGDININLSLGDIVAQGVSGNAKINGAHSSLKMEGLTGKYAFELVNSGLFLRPQTRFEHLKVETKNGDVTLASTNINEYNCILRTSYGEIKVPEAIKEKVQTENNQKRFQNKNEKSPLLEVHAEFGNILFIK